MTEDNEFTCECGEVHEVGRTTVRQFIANLMSSVKDIDSELVISLHSGDNVIQLELIDVVDMEDEDDPTALIIAGLPSAWKAETGEDIPAGVLLLEDFEMNEIDDSTD